MRELPPDSLRHRRPWLAPAFGVACFALAFRLLLRSADQFPGIGAQLLRIATFGVQVRNVGFALIGLVAVAAALEQLRRFDKTRASVAMFLRLNRAFAYGALVTIAVGCLLFADQPARWGAFLHGTVPQLQGLALWFLAASVIYLVVLHPPSRAETETMAPFPVQIAMQRQTFDFTLGARHPGDWEHAEKGAEEWAVWPEAGTFGNLLCLGQIGSGKTSQVADPLVLQALLKHRGLPERPSMVVLDLKGNQGARYWEWAKQLSRAEDFWVLRPDIAQGADGDVIPRDRYIGFNVLGGWEETDLLAIEFQEALEATKERPSPDYFQSVQKEFLVHALRIMTAAIGTPPDLADIQAFSSSPETRNTFIEQTSGTSSPAIEDSRRYFIEEFLKLSREDQAGLLRGLGAQLTLLTNNAIQEAFCPKRRGGRRIFGTWRDEVLNKPAILVVSCPPATYTDTLSRLLGLLVLKSFQQAMLERTDAGFRGDKKRPVYLVIDEAHAFLNKRLGDFMSVSREARVSTWLLTQSLSQLPEHYRNTILSNTRTRLVLSVSDETAQAFEKILGDVEETKEQLSVNEGLQGVGDHALREKKVGRSKSLGVSRSYRTEVRPRFSAHAIQHLAPFRAVAHVFDGEKQREAELIATVPWYRLRYYLLDPRQHPQVRCKEGGAHTYAMADGLLRCSRCTATIKEPWAVDDYNAVEPALARLADAKS
jgi:hypothetical protein